MQKCIFSGLNTKHSLLEGKLTQNDGNVAIQGKLVRYKKFTKCNFQLS